MPPPLRFGPFVMDPGRRVLIRNGRELEVGQKALALLGALLEANGAIVPKASLIEAAWHGQAVEESNLTVQIAALRRCLGRQPNGADWIETVARHGYRLSPSRSLINDAAVTGAFAGKTRLAVLPFAAPSAETAGFADGLVDDLITDLSKVPGLLLIARTSTFAFRGRSLDARDLARELGVKYLVQGSVRQSDHLVRVNVQVVDGEANAAIWSERYEGTPSDFFRLQDQLGRQIAGAVPGAVAAGHAMTAERAPTALAHELFVQGRALVSQWSDSNAAGRSLLLGSIELEPEFASSHAWLAHSHHFDWLFSEGPNDESRQFTRAASDRAMSLDPDEADARLSLGLVHAYDGKLSLAFSQFDGALATNPNHADAWLFLSDLMCFDGRAEEGVECARNAFQLNPYPPAVYHWHLGYAQYAAERYAEAEQTLRQSMTRHLGSRRILAACLAQMGRLEEAHVEAAAFLASHPGFSVANWAEKHPFRRGADLKRFVEGYTKAGLPR